MRYIKIMLFSGVIAIIFAWIIIGVCWLLNPWFVFVEDAFSDFGGPESCCPWLYNYGLIITGLLVIIYGSAICLVSEEKIQIIGGSYISLSGVFLALIGVFPTGTKPHTFVSSWFFLQVFIGFIILGLGIHRKKIRYGLEMSLIVIFSIVLAIIIEIIWGWPSAAVIEACGIIIIDMCVLLSTRICLHQLKNNIT